MVATRFGLKHWFAGALMAFAVAQGSGTYSISSRATRPDGTRVQIQAAIRIGGGGGFGR